MENKSLNPFGYVNHYAKHDNIPSISIIEAKLDYIPKITIAIPTYKRATLLKEAIDSALSQVNYDKYDIIVVDNNSERFDETENLMLTYNNPRLNYYKNTENIGMVGNWNRLFTLAKGEWVVMLHDDDLLFNDYLSFLFKNYVDSSHEVDAFFCKECISMPIKRANKAKIWNLRLDDFLLGNIIGAPVGMCIKKRCVIELGGFSSDYYPSLDYDFYVKLLYNRYKAAQILGYPLCLHRIYANESLKADVLLGFLEKDGLIKENILREKSMLMRMLWHRYFKISNIKYLKYTKLRNHDDLVQSNMLKKLEIQETIYSKILYYIMRICKAIDIYIRVFINTYY